uniref:Oxidoreductase R1 n=1 Tax=Phoma sp. (strain ATCC 20986 / MF5453) TaxID=1828523 RepID=MFR1_PHOSM|nr:RecName: Full=Oxidoreductase R1; AltName: Full=Squalestatin S1 biosynthesis cluster protein R1 [Phoma sp. MF5453]AMY15069.1 putative non-heme iron dependent [Phoma sp. MF5453]
MATAILPSTSGVIGLWDGTTDGKEGFMDYANGDTNVKQPKEYEIQVHDIRKLDPQPTLLKNGYELVDIPTVVTDEQFIESGKSDEGNAYIKDVYFAECKRIIEEVSGGVDLIIPVSFRMREQKGEKESTTKKLGNIESRYAPRPVAHLDRDTPTAITVLEETVGKEKAQELLSKHKRWAQVNVWRPIGNPATMWPLCFLNHDRIPTWNYDTHVGHVWSLNDPRVSDRGQKTYDCVVKHDDRYDYHYVSDLRPEECLVFCSFDSIPKYAMPHSAFWDNNVPADAPNRRSIEVRSLVFF